MGFQITETCCRINLVVIKERVCGDDGCSVHTLLIQGALGVCQLSTTAKY